MEAASCRATFRKFRSCNMLPSKEQCADECADFSVITECNRYRREAYLLGGLGSLGTGWYNWKIEKFKR